jgi:hypothetical protein
MMGKKRSWVYDHADDLGVPYTSEQVPAWSPLPKPCKSKVFQSPSARYCPINGLTAKTQRNMRPTKNPAFAGLFYRGARIRTGDLADPNGARYQAAPRPDADRSIPHRAL